MAVFDKNLITRAIQKNDRTRVALRKAACGAVMIDGLPFVISTESDGVANNKGVVFTLSGEAVESGSFKLDMIEVTYPKGNAAFTVKRKAAYHKKNDGKNVYRCSFPEVKIPQCSDSNVLEPGVYTEEDMSGGMNKQIIFRFTPCYSEQEHTEVMINIYPSENPLDGSCTEWIPVTSDHEFFEHGGLRAFSESSSKKKKKKK